MLSNSSSVPLPLMIDDEYLRFDVEGAQPVNTQSRIGSFVFTIKLLDILNEVLQSFYAQDDQAQAPATGKNEATTMPDLHEMLRLNSKLDQFSEALPECLRLQNILLSSHTPTSSAILQARVLYCR